MKRFIHIAAFAAILMAVSACVYPFEPELDAQDSRLVVDGDIHIGGISTFSFSRVYPLDETRERTEAVWIKDPGLLRMNQSI